MTYRASAWRGAASHLSGALKKAAFTIAAALAVVCLVSSDAEASHFRYATVSSRPILNSSGMPTGTVEFRIRSAWRRSFFGNLVVGNTFSPETFFFGDGASQPLTLTVTSFDSAEDWVVGEQTITHPYVGAGPFTAFGASNARVGNLNNGSNASWRYEALVRPLTTNNSPVSALPPIVTVQKGTAAQFFVPASDAERDTMTFRVAPASATGTGTTAAPGLSINSNTGLVTWNNNTLDTTNFWFTQIIIEDRDAVTGAVKSSIPIDVLLRITTQTSIPPICQVDGSNAPKSFTVAPGTQVNFTVTGIDPDNGPITLGASGMPPLATTTPPLPINNTSPRSTQFSWTPNASDIGSRTISFYTADVTGLLTLNSVNIFVGCSYSLVPAIQEIKGTAGSGSATLSTQPACPWTATANVPWLHPTASGAGGGPVAFTFDANLTPLPRIGRLSVQGSEVQVTQPPATSTINAGGGISPALSGNGRYVAFATDDKLTSGDGQSDTNAFTDVYVLDRVSNKTVRVSASSTNVQANGNSSAPAISETGRYVAFQSDASNLIGKDKNGKDNDTNARVDVFVRDRDTDGNGVFDEQGGVGTTLVSRATVFLGQGQTLGSQGRGDSTSPAISGDGQVIVFASDAANLAKVDKNNQIDVFMAEVTKVSATGEPSFRVTPIGIPDQQPPGAEHPAISANGRYIVFDSESGVIIPGDTNGVRDVFVYDRTTQAITRISLNADGTQTNAVSSNGSVSNDGAVAFTSEAALVASDTNGVRDIYSRALGGGPTVRESVTSNGEPADGISTTPSISADGRFVAFTSTAANLSSLDTNGSDDVFVRDRVTGLIRLASVPSGDGVARRNFDASLSADGQAIAFSSETLGAPVNAGNEAAAPDVVRTVTVQGLAPASLTISPTHGPVGANVQISGTNLAGATVKFDDVTTPILSTIGQSAVVVAAPQHALGQAIVRVEVGAASIPIAAFLYEEPPPTNTPNCQLGLPGTQSVESNETSLGVTVNTIAGCEWTPVSEAEWIQIQSPQTAINGTGTIDVKVKSNPNASDRTGRIIVNGQAVQFSQKGSGCDGTLSVVVQRPRSVVDAETSTQVGDLTVAIGARCSWSAQTDATWLEVTPGVGSGPLQYKVLRNPDPTERMATISVVGGDADDLVRVTQLAQPPPPTCTSYDVSPSEITVERNGGSGRVNVTTQVGCPWSVRPEENWITAGAPTLGSGGVTIQVNETNDAGNRRGQVIVAGKPVTVVHKGKHGERPFGLVELPVQNASGLSGSIALGGWILDDTEIPPIEVWRVGVDNEGPLVFVGTAVPVKGSRPDIARDFPFMPFKETAGWGYLLLTNFLPHQGDGSYTLVFFVKDATGQRTELDRRTITTANNSAVKPFGAIDTPGQGEVISGTSYPNFGWVLSRGPALAFPPNGTVTTFIDGVLAGSPIGWSNRDDLTKLFPATIYPGVTNALGVLNFDTTTLANGDHTIAWVVTDDHGEAAGIGSRFFTVANADAAVRALPVTSSMLVAEDPRALPLSAAPVHVSRGVAPGDGDAVLPDRSGTRHIAVETIDLVRISFGESTGAAMDGYLLGPDGAAPLPAGLTLDRDGAAFAWQLGPGFVGVYDLVFVRTANGVRERIPLRVVVEPRRSEFGPPLAVDAPAAGHTIAGSFTVTGSVVGGAARQLTDIVVYAQPAAGGQPMLVGRATVSSPGHEAGTEFSGQFARTTYSVDVSNLSPGTYNLRVTGRSRLATSLDVDIWIPQVTVR